ncbi:hypothetical protein HanRHA438_Chr11g0489851 [Helianthus annuus]|nr:hypothetical protein HanIR_Chr11g0513531 [Helianthus annuus]KAJ0869503.1 hypothetical protein HanRHA438_Chr11g0489851 [Helianthus annuus]
MSLFSPRTLYSTRLARLVSGTPHTGCPHITRSSHIVPVTDTHLPSNPDRETCTLTPMPHLAHSGYTCRI